MHGSQASFRQEAETQKETHVNQPQVLQVLC